MSEIDVNWLAVAVAALVPMVVGVAWYDQLFGDAWLRTIGKTREEVGGPAAGYVLALVASVVNSVLLAVLVDWAGADSLDEGLLVGVVAWGFVATTSAVNSLFAGRPLQLYAIDAAYHLASLAPMTIVLAVWD